MFAITPQSVTLIVPGADGPMPEIVFRNDGEDVSRSVMEIVLDGDRHILTFNTRGMLVDQQFVEYVEPESEKAAELFTEDGFPPTTLRSSSPPAPAAEPMATAPSSPLPGSPPPHPLDQPDPGKVNIAKDLQGA